MPDYTPETNQPNPSNPQQDPGQAKETDAPAPTADHATDVLDAERKGLNDPEDATPEHGDDKPDNSDDFDGDPEYNDDPEYDDEADKAAEAPASPAED